MAECAIEMRKDFLVVHLTPRCWHCDKYIRIPCATDERTRKERMPNRPTDMVDKRTFCQGADSIPDESKKCQERFRRTLAANI